MEFYNKNHKDFSDTRHSVWKSVKDFCDSMHICSNANSTILDAGCGNGKNIIYMKNRFPMSNIVGFDTCIHFVDECKKKKLNVHFDDVRCIQYKNNSFDYILCIAVLHHLKTEKERIEALKQLLRILKPGGKLLITMWAYESDIYSKKRKFTLGNNIVMFKNYPRYYYVHNESSFHNYCKTITTAKYNIFWEKGNWNAIFEK